MSKARRVIFQVQTGPSPCLSAWLCYLTSGPGYITGLILLCFLLCFSLSTNHQTPLSLSKISTIQTPKPSTRNHLWNSPPSYSVAVPSFKLLRPQTLKWTLIPFFLSFSVSVPSSKPDNAPPSKSLPDRTADHTATTPSLVQRTTSQAPFSFQWLLSWSSGYCSYLPTEQAFSILALLTIGYR